MRFSLGSASLALAVLAGAASAQDNAPVVAVMDFTNASMQDHATYQPFTAGLAGMLLTELRPNPRMRLVERERLRTVLEEIGRGAAGQVDPATAARAGKILGARHMIFGAFIIDRKGNLRIDARAVNVETGLVEHVETVTDDADNLLRAVVKLGRQMSERMNLAPDPVGGSGPAQQKTEPARKGQLLVDLKFAMALEEEDRKNNARAVQLYKEYLAGSPEHYAPHVRQEAEARIKVLSGGEEELR